ncbi:MAG: DnaB-like helicase C-terminal domain-containing protein, partial [Candidatus Poseidoniales archaeon]
CDANVPIETDNSRGSMDQARVVSIKQRSSDTGQYNASHGVFYKEIRDRKLEITTAEKYGVGFRGKDIVFPYGNDTAAKVRMDGEKKFKTEGDWNEIPYLFGQERFNAGGSRVLVVEGEFDALAAYQMLGSKYAVVSVRNGASSAVQDCRNNYEWLDSFKEIVFCFDADDAGQKAQARCAELFSHKSWVMTPINGLKDPCEYLFGRTKEFFDSFRSAQKWTPDGIIAGTSLYDDVMKPLASADCMYPFDGLNKLTYGIRQGEMVTVTAGSGLGKSQFLREIIWHMLQHTQEKIGMMFLEESVRKTALSMMSLAANKPLHLPDVNATQQEKDDAFDKTLGTDRLYFFDHFGSSDVDNIVNRVRYLSKAIGCRYIFVDHISIIVSAQSNGDERKAIDEIMTKLRTLVQETGISLVCVSHLKRPDTKGHEEGAATSLSQLRGSGSIAQLSDMVIGLERNGQADDEIERNTTKVRVLKNRFCGTTGPACNLLYSLQTGRMTEVDEQDDDEAL